MEVTPTGNAGEGFSAKKTGIRASAPAASNNFSETLTASLEAQPATSAPARPESPPAKLAPAKNEPIEYIVKRGDTLWKIGRQLFNRDPFQIARDNGLANPNLIRPGQKLIINPAPPRPAPPTVRGEVTASWYGPGHHNKLTASGQKFDMNKNTLAHKTLPMGTRVRLVNPDNGKSAEGVVNDRGPFIKGRDVDVSYAMAKQLGFVRKGVTKLDIETI
ncbi:MAG: septal ring lytic transglycosylase RlpA family protein [Syntrophales bacterium]